MLAALGGCAPDYSPNTYAAGAVQQANKVEQGLIVGVRQVDVSAPGAVGAIVGGAAGGIVGAQTPGGGVASAFGALGGSLIGGIVGTTVEHATDDTFAFEYVVRKGNGELVSVTQKDTVPLALGQKVLVIAGTQARIVADYTVPAAEPKVAQDKAAQDKAAQDKAAQDKDKDKAPDAGKQPDKDKPPGTDASVAAAPAIMAPAASPQAAPSAPPPTPASELAKPLPGAPTPLPLPGVPAETHQP